MEMMEVSLFGRKIRLVILVIFIIICIIIFGQTIYSCGAVKGNSSGSSLGYSAVEGFTSGAPYGPNAENVNTSSWGMPNLTVHHGKPLSKGVQDILNRPQQPIPLPEGELDMFYKTPFKPECCPNTFSNSKGCAFMTVKQYNYLVNRGGNNIPYSEY